MMGRIRFVEDTDLCGIDGKGDWRAGGNRRHAGIGADPADGGNADASWAAAAGDRIAAGHYQ